MTPRGHDRLVNVAVVQAGSIPFDSDACVDKAVQLVGEAECRQVVPHLVARGRALRARRWGLDGRGRAARSGGARGEGRSSYLCSDDAPVVVDGT